MLTKTKTTDHVTQPGLLDTPEAPVNVLQALVDAVCYLDSVCDGAHSHDKHGFNGRDAQFGKAMAARILDGQSLTPNMIRAIGKMLQTYRTQLTKAQKPLPTAAQVTSYLASLAPVLTFEQKQAVAFGPSAQPGWVSVTFPYAMLDKFKDAIGYQDRSWDKLGKRWHIRAECADTVKSLLA